METNSSKSASENRLKSEMAAKPQTEVEHPAEWQRDLNPDHMAGQNLGEVSAAQERDVRTAHEHKDVHRTLHDQFSDDELKQIPILPAGQRLQQGATYLDLRDAQRREITATGDMSAGPDNLYVPKDQVPYSLWNRLRGVENPERIAERRDPDLGG